jgi:hypothetical protein
LKVSIAASYPSGKAIFVAPVRKAIQPKEYMMNCSHDLAGATALSIAFSHLSDALTVMKPMIIPITSMKMIVLDMDRLSNHSIAACCT